MYFLIWVESFWFWHVCWMTKVFSRRRWRCISKRRYNFSLCKFIIQGFLEMIYRTWSSCTIQFSGWWFHHTWRLWHELIGMCLCWTCLSASDERWLSNVTGFTILQLILIILSSVKCVCLSLGAGAWSQSWIFWEFRWLYN